MFMQIFKKINSFHENMPGMKQRNFLLETMKIMRGEK